MTWNINDHFPCLKLSLLLLSKSAHTPGPSPLLWPFPSGSLTEAPSSPPASFSLRVLQVLLQRTFSGSRLCGWSCEVLWFTCHLHAMSRKSISSTSPPFEFHFHIRKWQLNMTSLLHVPTAPSAKYLYHWAHDVYLYNSLFDYSNRVSTVL